MANADSAASPHASAPSPNGAPADGAAPALVPAPWALSGQAVVLLLRATARRGGTPGLAGRFSAVAFVDYATSGVGPYRELLHVPRVTRWSDAIGPTVAGIWVTTQASVVSGNHNWGLTKKLARIERERVGGGRPEHWIAEDEAGELGSLVHRPWGVPVPVGKPRAGGRLLQRRDGFAWATPVSVFGLARPTSVWDVKLDADRVTDLERHRIVAAFSITSGRMGFHAATIRPTT
ncbi:MAG: acetoacetate decarboxylase family protein [Solirubrobacteraceae bacterium]|nr:acetoacetate decarboxylase family protein [Solirubrobacteraceae bacterium]